ncbi:MAG: Ig-like domain-containing protein [Erysipelotrichaceae bacterium]|nr:Ig-like domain-containing protein [Erysipelotrichaceae bacterium]
MKKIIACMSVLLIVIGSFAVVPVQADTTYGLNQTWRVAGQWEFKVTNVQTHEKCNQYSTEEGEQVVIITYQYKNTGYKGSFVDLYMLPSEVYDEYGNAASTYSCTHILPNHELKINGTSIITSMAYILPKTSKSITVHMEKYTDARSRQSADFKVNVGSSAPTYVWNTSHIAGAGDYDYKNNETWRVADNWELTVTGARTHQLCNQFYDGLGEQVVLIDYNYKNIGYTGKSMGLYINLDQVYDEFGNAASTYPCTHDAFPKELNVKGTSCSASSAVILPKTSKYIFVTFEEYDKDINRQEVTYVVSINGTAVPEKALVSSVKLSKTSLTLTIGKTATLTATVSPSNASDKSVSWTSSNTSVATVDSNGRITAIGAGTATITVTAIDGSGKKASCKVTVNASAPKLVAIYNSAKGADIRWKPQAGVTTYYLMRKYNGVWSDVRPLPASSLTKDGSNYKYIDTEIAGNYGTGYIYSIAVMSNGKLVYDTRGLPLYRLKQPTISSITSTAKGTVTLTWTKENCHGYEIQYSSDNGSTWTKYPRIDSGTTVSQTIGGLDPGIRYAFRIRCQKTNKDRGTTWSQYSAWRSVTVSSGQSSSSSSSQSSSGSSSGQSSGSSSSGSSSSATVFNDSSTVYYVSSGSVYHLYSGCRSLARSKNIHTTTLGEARAMGRSLCKNCQNMSH